MAVISSVGTDPAFNAPSPWLFRLPPTNDEIALALATFVSEELGRRRVAVIYSNDRFGRYLTEQFTHEFAATGGEVAERAPFLPGLTEYRAYARRLARGGARALVFVGDANEADEMVRALRQAGSTIPVVVAGGLGADEAIDPVSSVQRIKFYQRGAVGTEYELRFADSYQERHGAMPTDRAALAYDATTLLGQATVVTGGNRAAVRNWLAEVGRGSPPHLGVTGQIRFDSIGGAVDQPLRISGTTR